MDLSGVHPVAFRGGATLTKLREEANLDAALRSITPQLPGQHMPQMPQGGAMPGLDPAALAKFEGAATKAEGAVEAVQRAERRIVELEEGAARRERRVAELESRLPETQNKVERRIAEVAQELTFAQEGSGKVERRVAELEE